MAFSYPYHINTFDHEPVSLGIDEAGRGPVLGPMVYAAFYTTKNFQNILKEQKFDDSKKLTEGQRNSLFVFFNENQQYFGWDTVVLMPEELSAKMLRKNKYNLNEISHNAAIQLIRNTLQHGINVTHVYVDTVGKCDVYQRKLKSIFPQLDITVAEKADSKYLVVSAASICAKVTRDFLLREWIYDEKHKQFSKEFGSGYPGDAVTRKYLKDSMNMIFGFPKVVRFSWETAKEFLNKNAHHIEWYEEDSMNMNGTEGQGKILNFFQTSQKNKSDNLLKTNKFMLKNRLSHMYSIE